MRELPFFIDEGPIAPCEGIAVPFREDNAEGPDGACCEGHKFDDSWSEPEPVGKLIPKMDASAELLSPLFEMCDPMTPPLPPPSRACHKP